MKGTKSDASGTKNDAARAASAAAAAVLDLLNVVRFSDGKRDVRDAEEAVGHLLKATKCAMEIAGFKPDEVERGQLYRSIVEYLGAVD